MDSKLIFASVFDGRIPFFDWLLGVSVLLTNMHVQRMQTWKLLTTDPACALYAKDLSDLCQCRRCLLGLWSGVTPAVGRWNIKCLLISTLC